MYKRKSIKKLGRTHSHRKALIKNLLRSILKSGYIQTSSVKAKVLRGELESIFNKVKQRGIFYKKFSKSQINLIFQLWLIYPDFFIL